MADHPPPTTNAQQLPPSDVEKTQTLARLMHRRIRELTTQRAAVGSLPAADARELYVLEHLKDHWLLEAGD